MRSSAVAVAILVAVSFAAGGPLGVPLAMPVQNLSAAPLFPSQQFEDRPERLIPAHPRTEADEDRLEAAALFASGRMLEQRQDPSGALRRYQRAVRLDPKANTILREVVPLAYSLNRRTEALRYAVKLCQQDASDLLLSRRIGMFLMEEGKFKDAAAVLENCLKHANNGAKPTADLVQLQLDLGRVYFLLNRYADAAKLLDKVWAALDKPKDFGIDAAAKKALVGQDGLTYELMAANYLEVDRPDSAAAAFAKLNDVAPSKATASLNEARVEEKAKHPDKALAKLGEYFDAKPADLSLGGLELLENTLKDLKQSDQLLPRLETLHKAMPDSVAIDWLLAEKYRQAGKGADAKPLYEAVIKGQPSSDAYKALAAICRETGDLDTLAGLLGDMTIKTGSLEALGDDLKKLTATDDQSAKLADKLFAAVRSKHSAAGKADYHALRGAATLAAARKKFDVAEEFYNLAIKANPADVADVLLTWGSELFLADQDAAAAKLFERGIKEGKLPNEKPAFEYYLAGALEMQGQTDAALAVARKMVDEKKPKETRYAVRAAWILFHAKRYDAAYDEYRKVIAAHDADFDSEENRDTLREAREALSSVCVERHRDAEAEELLQQVLDEFPDDVGAQNDLGYLWCDAAKHLERSLAMIQKAVAAEPDNVAYRDSLGWVFFRLGRNDAALVELKKACAGDDPDGAVLDHLAEVYLKTNQPALARETWQRALKNFEKQKDDEKIRQTRDKLDKLSG